MPRGKKVSGGAKAKPAVKRPPAKRANAARRMPPPMPSGEVLTDFTKKVEWILGNSVGKGGFGEIYTASKRGDRDEGQYVVKIEPHENGPLFTELSFYRRVAKPPLLSDWCKSHSLSYLAIPEFVAAGEHMHSGLRYRFMVMHRFGEDIEKKFCAVGRQFGIKTVCYLALRLLEALEFLHESGYVHADVKGSNLLTGLAHPHQVYLVDYGLAYRYFPDDVHKEYKEDPRRRHDGTIEFTSIDAHNGVNPSRRGDLEILGYCLLQWASGQLPWEDNLADKDYVAREKTKYKSDARKLMKDCFHTDPPSCLLEYMRYVYKLDYTQTPDYSQMKGFFLRELKGKDDHKDLDWISRKRKPVDEIGGESSSLKKARSIPPAKTVPAKRRKAKEEPVSEPPKRKPPRARKEPADESLKRKSPRTRAREEEPADESPKPKPRRTKKPEPGDILPTPFYPSKLGYTNRGKAVKKCSAESDDEYTPDLGRKRPTRSKR